MINHCITGKYRRRRSYRGRWFRGQDQRGRFSKLHFHSIAILWIP